MFKHIFWDNDGVLVDTEPVFFQATRDTFKKYGVDLTHDFYVNQQLKFNKSTFSVLIESGLPETEIPRIRKERNQYYTQLLKKNVSVMPGIREVLSSLHGKIPMGIVTSSDLDHFEIIMKQTDLAKYFEFFITSADVKVQKPSPEAYLLALDRVPFSNNECLVIEDTERGVTAAKKAGLTCFAVPNNLSKYNDFSHADRVLKSITELPNIIL